MKLITALTLTFITMSSNLLASEDEGRVIIRLDMSRAGVVGHEMPRELDIAGQNVKEGYLDIVGSQEYFEMLSQQGYPVTIVELQPLALDDKYLRYEEIVQMIQELAEKYPELVTVKTIGKTNAGRPLYAVRITTAENADAKPAILFNGMHHAREIMTTEVTTDIMNFLLTNFDNPQTPFVKDWLENMAVWVIPQFNPDGNTIVWEKDTWWRKNARGDGSQVWGVDLNRNYPFQWSTCNGSSGTKGSDTYRGDSPASEPETKAMMNFVKSENIAMDISYHSYSELVIAPYGCRNQYTPEDFIVKEIGKTLASKLVKDAGGSATYDYGTGWELLYPVDGEDISWMYNEVNTMAYVIEVNASTQGFQPNYERWRESTVKRQRAGWTYMLNRLMAGPQVRGRMIDDATGAPVNGGVTIQSVNYRYGEKPRRAKNGNYQKLLAPGSYELVFKADGYETQTIPVSVDNSAVDLDVHFRKSSLF